LGAGTGQPGTTPPATGGGLGGGISGGVVTPPPNYVTPPTVEQIAAGPVAPPTAGPHYPVPGPVNQPVYPGYTPPSTDAAQAGAVASTVGKLRRNMAYQRLPGVSPGYGVSV